MNLMPCIDLYLTEKVYPENFFSIQVIESREYQFKVFDDVRNKLISSHCTVTLNVLTVTDENHKRCIFQILLVNVPSSYNDNHQGGSKEPN